jgi:hypothetical protein
VKLDEESAAQIQAFVSWASGKGYHVIGALISKDPPLVRTFATGPEGSMDTQAKHVEKLVKIMYHSVMQGKLGEALVMPLGEM